MPGDTPGNKERFFGTRNNKEGQPRGIETLSREGFIFKSIEGIVNSPNLNKDDISNFLKSIDIGIYITSIDEITSKMRDLSKNNTNYLKKVEEKLKQFCSKKIDKIQELLSNIFSSGEINSEWLKIICKYNTVYDFVNYLRRDLSGNFNELDKFEGVIKEYQKNLNVTRDETIAGLRGQSLSIFNTAKSLSPKEGERYLNNKGWSKAVVGAVWRSGKNRYNKITLDSKKISEKLSQLNDEISTLEDKLQNMRIRIKDAKQRGETLYNLGLAQGDNNLISKGLEIINSAQELSNEYKLSNLQLEQLKNDRMTYERLLSDSKNKGEDLQEHEINTFQSGENVEFNDFLNTYGRNIVMLSDKMGDSSFNTLKQLYENICSLTYSADDIIGLKNNLNQMLLGVDINNSDVQYYLYNELHTLLSIKNSINDQTKLMALLYSILIDGIDVESDDDVDIFIRTVQGEETMYSEKYRAYCDKMNQVEDDIITEIAVNTLTKRYEAAERLAETKKVYGSGEFISFFPSDKSKEGNSFRIAGNLVGENGKNLNHYKIKADRTDDEEKALQYTAFNVTFNNIFSVDDPIVQKLANQNINLRDDLSRNGIYYQDTNIFNEEARNKYIQSEKFLSAGLTTEEISSLSESLKNLPEEVKSNYEILSGNFDADQGSFEEIAKIYALGEIINNIRNYFKNNKDNPQLQNIVKGLELDENEPAKIEGDCLYLKGKIDGTVTNIKYDLRTGKLYMNSFFQKVEDKEKFVIGNDEPTTEIGNLNSFQDILDGYKSDSFISISDDSPESSGITQPEDVDDTDNQDKKEQNTLKSLTENKLIEDLGHIGEIVKKRADKRGTKNSLINNLLRSFNILPDNGNLKTIDVDGGSNLYILLESIKNTNDSSVLNKFSDRMSRLLESCGFKRGSNIEYPENEVDFDIENMPDNQKSVIVPIQEAVNNFFKEDGEKANIKDRKDYFDGSFNLSFAGVIVQNFCEKFGAGWELNISNIENYVKTVQDCELDSVLSSIN